MGPHDGHITAAAHGLLPGRALPTHAPAPARVPPPAFVPRALPAVSPPPSSSSYLLISLPPSRSSLLARKRSYTCIIAVQTTQFDRFAFRDSCAQAAGIATEFVEITSVEVRWYRAEQTSDSDMLATAAGCCQRYAPAAGSAQRQQPSFICTSPLNRVCVAIDLMPLPPLLRSFLPSARVSPVRSTPTPSPPSKGSAAAASGARCCRRAWGLQSSALAALCAALKRGNALCPCVFSR